MNWYGMIAWRIHCWVRPTPGNYRLGAFLSNRIADAMFKVWYAQWRSK